MALRIALVELPAPMLVGEDGVPLGTYHQYVPKPFLYIVGTILRNAGFEVHCIDLKARHFQPVEYGSMKYAGQTITKMVAHPLDAADEEIVGADILGLNISFTEYANVARMMIEHVRAHGLVQHIMVGGTDAVARPDFYLRCGADAVVMGQGDVTGPALARALAEGTPLSQVPGIAYLSAGQVQRTAPAPPVPMDETPLPDFSLVDYDAYIEDHEGPLPPDVELPLIYFESSRGCAEKCPFCTTPFIRSGYNEMLPERVEEWLDHFVAHGIQTIVWVEDALMSRLRQPYGRKEGKRRILRIAAALREREMKVEWGNGLQNGLFIDPETGLVDEELIAALYGSDLCYRTYWPLESLYEVRGGKPVYLKLPTVERQVQILAAALRQGLQRINFGVIVGTPWETMETLDITKRRAIEIKAHCLELNPEAEIYFQLFSNMALPGAAQYHAMHHHLAFDPEIDPEVWTFYTPHADLHLPHEVVWKKRQEMAEEINGAGGRLSYAGQSGEAVAAPTLLVGAA